MGFFKPGHQFTHKNYFISEDPPYSQGKQHIPFRSCHHGTTVQRAFRIFAWSFIIIPDPWVFFADSWRDEVFKYRVRQLFQSDVNALFRDINVSRVRNAYWLDHTPTSQKRSETRKKSIKRKTCANELQLAKKMRDAWSCKREILAKSQRKDEIPCQEWPIKTRDAIETCWKIYKSSRNPRAQSWQRWFSPSDSWIRKSKWQRMGLPIKSITGSGWKNLSVVPEICKRNDLQPILKSLKYLLMSPDSIDVDWLQKRQIDAVFMRTYRKLSKALNPVYYSRQFSV